ncbi:MAG: hypothetical protein AUK17_00925 [Parcubacteria group bacterium CG2_30_44_18]|nr:MAG: hypothetical protein AUK17_00925 [Parcubacteria group bacterium CG2_30_44_18]
MFIRTLSVFWHLLRVAVAAAMVTTTISAVAAAVENVARVALAKKMSPKSHSPKNQSGLDEVWRR